jgi:hypothetical protein
MKQKIVNSIIIMLIIGIPLALFLIYRDMPKAMAVVEQVTKRDTIITRTTATFKLDDINRDARKSVGKKRADIELNGGWPKLYLYGVEVMDMNNLKDAKLIEIWGKPRDQILNFSEVHENKVMQCYQIDDPDYPTLYYLDVQSTKPPLYNLSIFTEAKPEIWPLKEGRIIYTDFKFAPLFDVTDKLTTIECVIYDEHAFDNVIVDRKSE